MSIELVVLGGHTVGELFVALCFASIAAPVPGYARSKYENTPGTFMRKHHHIKWRGGSYIAPGPNEAMSGIHIHIIDKYTVRLAKLAKSCSPH